MESFDTSRKFVENVESQGKMVEDIVASHLIRLAFMRSQKKQTFVHFNHIYYWKYCKGNEVDLIYNDGMGNEIPIKVKFQYEFTSCLENQRTAPKHTKFVPKLENFSKPRELIQISEE